MRHVRREVGGMGGMMALHITVLLMV